MKKLRYALIGCGRIATNHIKSAKENGLEIVAVCDIVPENMQSLLDKHDLGSDASIKRYENYKQLIDENDLDLVAVATSSGLHAEIVLYAVEHSINVIVEKPMAMSTLAAQQIIDKAKERGVVVSACHQNRFNVAVQEMRKALENGRFGKISHGSIHVRWNRNKEYYDQAKWRGTWKEDGGCLMNQCIHGVDLLIWMLGEVETVYGVLRNNQHPFIEAEDIGMAVLTFKNGAVATIEGTTNVYPKNLEETLYLFGEKGTVKLGGKSVNSIDVWEFSEECDGDASEVGLEEQTVNVYGNGHISLYNNVINAIISGNKPLIDAEAGKRAVEVILAIYQSAKLKRPVTLPLGDVRAIDFTGLLDK